MIGRELSHFKIVEQIGAGGMGVVYRAVDLRLDRPVALKVLPPGFLDDADRRDRFLREAKAASALNHPGIVTIHEVGSEDGVDFIAMELIDGQPLRELIPANGFAAAEAADLAAQVAHGLAAAHEKGIVHRDLKPENLIHLKRERRLKILDFGLAKLVQPAGAPVESEAPTLSNHTAAGAVMGTVGYMSPEQVRGEPVDARSDIFSLGAVLFEMLTGRRAFKGGTQVETLHAILKEEPPPLEASGKDVPPDLARIVRRCLEKDSRQRFQSARDLALALENVSLGRPMTTPPATPGRRRSIAWIALAVGGVAVIGLALAAWRGIGPFAARRSPKDDLARIHSIAVLPLRDLSGQAGEDHDYFADGLTEALITDLAKARALRVISRTSVMQYKATERPLPEIGRALGVEAVLLGSVLRDKDRVRVTAQLVDTANDRHLWAEEYDRDLRDVLTLQAEIAQSIVRAVHTTLTPAEEAQLRAARTVVPESHDAYLKGRFYLSRLNEPAIAKAIGFFEAAIAADPQSAEAYAALAEAHQERGIWGVTSPRETAARARAAALRALALDDTLAEAHSVLGGIAEVHDWDWATAEAQMKRAIELGGGQARVHARYAVLLHVLGRYPEAMAEIDVARRLDPLSAEIVSTAGRIRHRAGQYDEALTLFRECLELDPAYQPTYARMADVYLALGKPTEALAAIEKGRTLAGDTRRQDEGYGVALAAAGRTAEASAILNRMKDTARTSDQFAYSIAVLATALGRKDEALQWLEKAYEQRSSVLFLMNVERNLDPLRSDPRFQDLVRRMGFPPHHQ